MSAVAPLLALLAAPAPAQFAVLGERVHTLAGDALADGVVLLEGGRILAVGRAADVAVPQGFTVVRAAVVTPGLIDAHSVVGLSGILNYGHDQEQLDRSASVQPELSAIDAYNPRDPLVEFVRGLGITTLHTGHAPGELVSGGTIVVKTVGESVDEALLDRERAYARPAMVACTLGASAVEQGDKSPGTRAKLVAVLRAELIKASEHRRKLAEAPPAPEGQPEPAPPARDLRLEALGRVLAGEVPLLVTAQRATDIDAALRLAAEFGIQIVLDGAAEAYLRLDEIRAAGVPVILHPTMERAGGELENLSMTTARRLDEAGIRFALQSGYESYVPKTRIVLFEAAVAAKQGLPPERALAAITIEPARILGIESRVGSLEPGKDGDLALWDGDPFETTTHCVGVFVNGAPASTVVR
jgi:imidazolonepropionase-like amidohydrolase